MSEPRKEGFYWVKFQWLAREPKMKPWWFPGAYRKASVPGIGIWTVFGQMGIFPDDHPALLEIGDPIPMPKKYQREIIEKGWDQ